MSDRKLRIERFEERALLAATVDGIQYVQTGMAGATIHPVACSSVVECQVQSLRYWEFGGVAPSEVPYLTEAQIASLPGVEAFTAMSAASRAALNSEQVRALSFSPLRIDFLTSDQIAFLTVEQIQRVAYYDFDHLEASQIPLLTTSQIASIPSKADFSRMSAESRAALTPSQVQSINLLLMRIDLLTPEQRIHLTPSQIQALPYYDFPLLTADQARLLTRDQISSIPHPDQFSEWSTASRAALNASQVRSLVFSPLPLHLLTSGQIEYLTAEQVARVPYYSLRLLRTAQISQVTLTQIASMPASGTLEKWPSASLAALSGAQIRALTMRPMRAHLFSPDQVAQFSIQQIRELPYFDFNYLNAVQTPYLTLEQIGSIPRSDELQTWTAASRAALTKSQIQALRPTDLFLAFFTDRQIGFLTREQVQSLAYFDLHLLSPTQVGDLTPVQISTLSRDKFEQWTPESRAVLSREQLNALQVDVLGIDLLTESQRLQLSMVQVQTLNGYQFKYLPALRIAWLAPSQFAAVQDYRVIRSLSDEVRSQITREQLMSLPIGVWGNVHGVPAATMPPEGYQPMSSYGVAADGLANDPRTLGEHALMLSLVPHDQASNFVVRDGAWSDPAIWSARRVPQSGERVLIGIGRTVLFDAMMTSPMATLRIDGALHFAHDVDTVLRVDTLVVDTMGSLHIGDVDQPIAEGVTARILFATSAPIDASWDPRQMSRGLLSRGEVRIHGAETTSFVKLARDPSAGDTLLSLAQSPVNWHVGDRLILTGTSPNADDFHTEELLILGIEGTNVTVRPLQYDHHTPEGYDFSVYVAKQNRNVILASDMTNVPADQRPHIMFMHNPDVQMVRAEVEGFGRTNKLEAIRSPVVKDGAFQDSGNARGRYAVHFHRTGVDPDSTPAVVNGSVVHGSPGWGFVNHQSNVVMSDNVGYQVAGAAFATEDGNERGAFIGNLAIASRGSNELPTSRSAIHDFGHSGHGFWLQGPLVEVVDNVVAGSSHTGFAILNASSQSMIETSDLPDARWGGGKEFVPVSAVPLARFSGNIAFGVLKGLETWYVTPQMTDGNSTIEDFAAWNVRIGGLITEYSGHVTYRNVLLVGSHVPQVAGVTASPLASNITYENMHIADFDIGISVTSKYDTTINGGYLSARNGIVIRGADSTTRSVNIVGDLQFARLSDDLLHGEPQYDIFLSSDVGTYFRRAEAIVSHDLIFVNTNTMPMLLLHYQEQSPYFVPFPAYADSLDVPQEWIGLTNQQLRNRFGVSYAGGLIPLGAKTAPSIHAWVESMGLAQRGRPVIR